MPVSDSTTAAAMPPDALSALGLSGAMTPEEIEARRKKIMAAAGADPMARYGSAGMALFGARPGTLTANSGAY